MFVRERVRVNKAPAIKEEMIKWVSTVTRILRSGA